jgi:hypothetical protein
MYPGCLQRVYAIGKVLEVYTECGYGCVCGWGGAEGGELYGLCLDYCCYSVEFYGGECIHYVIFTGHMFEDLQTRAQKIPAPPSYKVDIIRFLHAI